MQIQKANGVSHVAVTKATKNLLFTLVKVEWSDKPVKMFEIRLLPQKWRRNLEIWVEDKEDDGSIGEYSCKAGESIDDAFCSYTDG
jgi:hypothetical protein